MIFVLGGPGSGKGTQCEKISEAFGYTHLSAGDLLREERGKEGSANKALIDSYIAEGKLVPTEILVNLFKERMEELSPLYFIVAPPFLGIFNVCFSLFSGVGVD